MPYVMTRKLSSTIQMDWVDSTRLTVSVPKVVVLVAAFHLLTVIAVHTAWLLTRNDLLLHLFFDYQGVLAFLFFDGLGLYCSIRVVRLLRPAEPLHFGWLLITCALAFRFGGTILTQVFHAKSELNPLRLFPEFNAAHAAQFQLAGTALGGTLHMAVLATGLFFVFRAYKQARLPFWLTRLDRVALVLVSAYTVYVLYELATWPQLGQRLTLDKTLTWFNDPLIVILLAEALYLFRGTRKIGSGLIARCWMAFTVAILLSSFGSFAWWLAWHSYLPYPYSAFVWYWWYFVEAAMALGPAYMAEAIRVAQARGAQGPPEQMRTR